MDAQILEQIINLAFERGKLSATLPPAPRDVYRSEPFDLIAAALAEAGSSIVQTVVSTTTSASSTTAAQNVLAATGHSATITPTSADSKILVLVSGSVYVFGGSSPTVGVTTVYRGTTNLAGSGTAKFMTETGYSSSGDTGAVSMIIMDSPASTSALTYRVYAGVTGGGSVEWNTSLFASIVLMEIK